MANEKVAHLKQPDTTTATKRTVKLSRPIQTHEGALSELTLEEPRAELLLKWGLPWRQIVMQGTDGSQKFEIEYLPDKMVRFLEAMSGVDSITLESMAAKDMNACFVIVMAMLQPGGSL